MLRVNRRTFLKTSAGAGGALVLGLVLPGCGRGNEAMAEPVPLLRDLPGDALAPNAFLRVDTDGSVLVMIPSAEMGQGVFTSLAMLVAEEMGADWTRVRAEHAPAHPAYANPARNTQATGGSASVRGFFTSLREAGATARDLLVRAGAARLQVPMAECRAEKGAVVHVNSDRRVPFGVLTADAARLSLPTQVLLKSPDELQLLGRGAPRLDSPPKVSGRALFGQDVQLPGMLIASVERSSRFGESVLRFDAQAARQIPGVRHIVPLEHGVAVVADGFEAALAGRARLRIDWQPARRPAPDEHTAWKRLHAALDTTVSMRNDGNTAAALTRSAKTISAAYEIPFQAHACMEPPACTVHLHDDGCELWAPTQVPEQVRRLAAEITGLPVQRIRVHTPFLGGGFGRRLEHDFVSEAVHIAKAVRVPVKLLWTREDDLQHDFYRPASVHRMSAGLDARGAPVAWRHHIASPSIVARRNPTAVKDGRDKSSVEGAVTLPYAIPNVEVGYAMVDLGVPVGFWRSVGHSQNVFAAECFLDELAAAAGRDPYTLRHELLVGKPRLRRVLDLAASRGDWGTPLPEQHGRGIAAAESFHSYVAQVAEVVVEGDTVRVLRVVCAVDCGFIVNPDTVIAQMEGSVVWGLTAALKGAIRLQNGGIAQRNFHDYPLLAMDEMPDVEVHLVQSADPPGGVGEPGVPPLAPAVANAVFAATGRPVRRLPIRLGDAT